MDIFLISEARKRLQEIEDKGIDNWELRDALAYYSNQIRVLLRDMEEYKFDLTYEIEGYIRAIRELDWNK